MRNRVYEEISNVIRNTFSDAFIESECKGCDHLSMPDDGYWMCELDAKDTLLVDCPTVVEALSKLDRDAWVASGGEKPGQ